MNMLKPDWKNFEEIITKIQKDAAPDAIVQHNQKIKGKSGRLRQIDVLLTKKIGFYSVLIAIECKRHRRRITIEKVESFKMKLTDIGASYGVIISSSGFDEGAKATAKMHNISLLSYTHAKEIDWQNLTGSNAWMTAYLTKIEDLKINIILKDKRTFEVSSKEVVIDNNQNLRYTFKNFVKELFNFSLINLKKIGLVEIEAGYDNLYYQTCDESNMIDIIKCSAQVKTFEYIINLYLAEGHVIIDEISQKPVFKQMTTKSFDWENVIKQPCREISPSEYEILSSQPNLHQIPLIKPLQRFWKLEITQKID
jgi:hypothetical protein